MSVWGMISRGEPSPRKEALLHLQSATFAGSKLIINTSIPGNGAIRVDEGDRQWKLLHGHQVSPMKGTSVTPCTARSGSGSGGNKTFPHPPILPNESSAWCPFGWTPPPRSDGKAELPRWPADVKCTSLPCVLPDDSPYLTGGHTLLFDLSNDMYEEHDVSAQHPDVVARLLARLEYYNHSHCGGATCPSDPGKFWSGCRGNATLDPKLGSVWLPWQGNPTPSVCDTNRGQWDVTELKSDDIAVHAPGGPFGLARKPPMGFRTLPGTAAMKHDDERYEYIDNSVIRVGIDVKFGGVISYLAPSEFPAGNVINSADAGREVQLAFYAEPSHYNPPTAEYPQGACEKPHLHKYVYSKFGRHAWPWAPVGAGDTDRNPATILSQSRDNTTINITSRPLQWPCHNVSCECTFETRTSVGSVRGDGVRVDATLRTFRTDRFTPRAWPQELPAVYSNAPYHRLVTYSGTAPFTQAATSEYNTTGGPGVRDRHPGPFPATEHWAALVNEDGFGMGIVNLDTNTFHANCCTGTKTSCPIEED